jgi:hypothetical protein
VRHRSPMPPLSHRVHVCQAARGLLLISKSIRFKE